jgi:hypothetical protein
LNPGFFQLPNYLFTEKAAAGLYTTAADLAQMIIEIMKCYNGYSNNLIISKETLQRMLDKEITINNNRWDLGFLSLRLKIIGQYTGIAAPIKAGGPVMNLALKQRME